MLKRLFSTLNKPLRAWHGVLLAILAVTGYAAASSLYTGSLVLPTSSDSVSSRGAGVPVTLTSKSTNSTAYNFVLTNGPGCGSSGMVHFASAATLLCNGGYTTAAGTINAAFFESPGLSNSLSVLCSLAFIIETCNVPPGVVTNVTASLPLLSSGGTTPDISVSPSPHFTGTITASTGFTATTGNFVATSGSFLGGVVANNSGPLEMCGGAGCGGGKIEATTGGNLQTDAAAHIGTEVDTGTYVSAGSYVQAATYGQFGQDVIFGDVTGANQSIIGTGNGSSACGVSAVSGFSIRSVTSSTVLLDGDASGNVGVCGSSLWINGNVVPAAFSSTTTTTTGTCHTTNVCALSANPACNGSGTACFFGVFLTGNNNGPVAPLVGTNGSGHAQLQGILNETGGDIAPGTTVSYSRYDS